MWNFIVTLFVGAVAGWLAGNVMKSKHGIIINIIIGLIGGVIGSLVLGLIGLGASGLIGGIVVSAFGACILIWVARKLGF